MAGSPKRREDVRYTPVDPDPIPGFIGFGHIKLQNVINCRDLGGMPAAGGKRIKKRRLMRSGALHDATAEDVKQLVRMHDLEYVVDLRAEYELEREPDPLPLMHDIEYVSLPALSDDSIGFSGLKDLTRDLKNMRQFTKNPFEFVNSLYPKCVLGEFGISAFSKLLNDLIEEEHGATLWHCTQGKDRTGIAAMLVEYALGVPWDYIEQDYLATNLFISAWADKMNVIMRKNPLLRGIGADLESYAYAHVPYVETALRAIVDNYGSVDNYMERALDFGPEKRERLRELYLE